MADGIVISNLTIPVAKGAKGDTGDAGKIISMSITMLDSTATPTVTNTGTQSEAVYTLGIPRGTGISSAVINEDGELVLTLTDETELNLGVIMPTSVASVSMDEEFNFVVTLTDGTETEVGNLAEEMEDVIETALADYYDKDTSDSMFALIDETGNKIDLSINNTTYVMTLTLKDKNNNTLSTGTVDLPLESVVVSGSYDSVNKKIVLTLQSGSTVEFSVADLVSGLQSEITPSNKLNADLVDDTSSTNKFVTSADKTNWDAKVGTTDYASAETGGVIKRSSYYGLSTDNNGNLIGVGKTSSEYTSSPTSLIVSKGTLESVITGKGLVSNTDYANGTTGGVFKTSSGYGTEVSTSGFLRGVAKSYSDYGNADTATIISKGTLDNVLTAVIGDIDTALDLINRRNNIRR